MSKVSKIQNNTLSTIPYWADNLLQGLVFYIGYKSKMYWNYDIMEGTIADEMCVLLNANFHKGEKALREVKYREIHQQENPDATRCDIVIAQPFNLNDEEQLTKNISAIIEIKRYKKDNDKLIMNDLNRVLKAVIENQAIRGFVIVVAQHRRPHNFVNEEGSANRKKFNLDNDLGIAKVRRVCKAATSYKKKESASYACLIEVIPNPPIIEKDLI